MREKELIKEIDYNRQYEKIDDRTFDGNSYFSKSIKLTKNVYNADELVDIDEQSSKLVKEVVRNFSKTFQVVSRKLNN